MTFQHIQPGPVPAPWTADGHALAPYWTDQGMNANWVCPHDGADLRRTAWADLPVCRRGDRPDDRFPDCFHRPAWDLVGPETLEMVTADDVPITGPLVPVAWRYDGLDDDAEFWVTPVPIEPTSDAPAAAAEPPVVRDQLALPVTEATA